MGGLLWDLSEELKLPMREQDRILVFSLQESEEVRRVGLVPWAGRRHRQIWGGAFSRDSFGNPAPSSCLL